MHNRIESIKNKLPEDHKDIAVLTRHIFEAFDQLIESHRTLIGTSSTAKIKPNPVEERTFFETITEMKNVILTELDKTTDDIEHLGDKHWEKNYKDGIE